ncbi:MAG: hypothetical protein LBL51_04490, partial [Synergistaceae bacterium]|nr:hypothetical protein [Synergistaceae bacterium]
MKVVNQITFEAKNDAEALRLAGERLGKDAVILSTRSVRVGGVLGFFQHHTLMVTAGVLQDDSAEGKTRGKESEKDDATAKERLVAFQKLLEFKQATEGRGGAPAAGVYPSPPAIPDGPGKVIYSPADVAGNKGPQTVDSVYLSSAGLSSANAETAPRGGSVSRSLDGLDTSKLREEVASLSERLDKVLQHFDNLPPTSAAAPAKVFEEGLPLPSPLSSASSSAADRRIENGEPYRRLLAAEVDPAHALRL